MTDEEAPRPSLEERKRILQEVRTGELTFEEPVALGSNRDQLFVRIPRIIEDKLHLQREFHDMLFTLKMVGGEVTLTLKPIPKNSFKDSSPANFIDHYEKALLMYLAKGSARNIHEVAQRTRMSWVTVNKRLKRLKEMGLVYNERVGNKSYWKLTNP